MQVKKCPGGYLVRLEVGEEVVASLSRFVKRHRVRSGWLQGIGAVGAVTLGNYDMARRRYRKREFAGDYELVGMMGNIAWLGREPVLHIHALIADPKGRVLGGHLFAARTSVTVEVRLEVWNTPLERRPDSRTGLNLLALRAGIRS